MKHTHGFLFLLGAHVACLLGSADTGLRAQLPPAPVPVENPLTPQKALLGKILFWEEQLSSDDTMACASCHQPEHGGSDGRVRRPNQPVNPGADGLVGTADDIRGSLGVVHRNAAGDFAPVPTFGLQTQVTGRSSNSAVGAAHHAELFWDGRASTVFTDPETQTVAIAFGGALESQSLGPILSTVEMGHDGRTWNDVRAKLQRIEPLRLATNITPDIAAGLAAHPTYPALFASAFGDSAITARRIAFALASYQRTLNPDQTPWDRFMAGNAAAMTPQQVQGWNLFQGNGRCGLCHTPPFFSDDFYHNLGIRPWQEDPGRMNVSQAMPDRGAFKTPSLRNAGLRPAMLHDGSMPALGDPAGATNPHSMVNLYLAGGGSFRDNLSTFLVPLNQNGVSLNDMLLIEDFVQNALTDPRVAQGLPPFDHPMLRGSRFGPRTLSPGLAGATMPALIDHQPAFPGSVGYQVGLTGGTGGGLGFLGFALDAFTPPAFVGTLPIHLGTTATGVLLPLQGTAGQPGYATWRTSIPNNQSLVGLYLYFQGFVQDTVSPGGIAASAGSEVRLR